MTPIKTKTEEILFSKYYKWLHSDYIPEAIVVKYLNDLKILKNDNNK